MIIVLNCPGCQKQYEIDGALAGKKSRCRQCGEVFRIPAPQARVIEPAPSSPASGPLQPSWTATPLADLRDGEPATPRDPRPIPSPTTDLCSPPRPSLRAAEFGTAVQPPIVRGRPASVPSVIDDDLPPPPRARYQSTRRRRSSTARDGDSDVGFAAMGVFIVLSALITIGMQLDFVLGEPSAEIRDIVLTWGLGIMLAGAFGLCFWGVGWLLGMAFREELSEGLLCLLIPFYAIYFAARRWGERRGAFVMTLAPLAWLALSAAIAFAGGYIKGTTRAIIREKERAEASAATSGANRPDRNATVPAAPRDAPPGSLATGPPDEFPIGPPGMPGVFPPAMPPMGPPVDVVQNMERDYQTVHQQYGDRTVAILVTGLPTHGDPPGADVTEAISKRIKELAPEIAQGSSVFINDRFATVVAPVNDIQGLASRIDFGTVRVGDYRIEIQLDARWAANVPRKPVQPQPSPPPAPRISPPRVDEPEIPLGADAITRSMIELKSSDQGTRKQAVERLRRSVPDGRVDQVVDTLIPLLEDDDGSFASDVAKALAVWRSPEAMAALIVRLRENRHFVRSEAIKALGKYREPRAAEAIVTVMKEDGFAVEEALKSMGEVAEPALFPVLRSADSGLRGHACRILAEIGGQKTLQEMQSLRPDPDFGVRMAAQDAWKKIVARVGPPTRPARGKSVGATGR